MRGFHWQLLALLAAVTLFVVTLITRTPAGTTNNNPAPDTSNAITQTPQDTENTTVETIATPEPTPTDAPPSPPIMVQAADTTTVGITTYREALVGGVQRLNPLLAGLNPVDADITSLIFEGLTRINEYGEVRPALAREWVVSFDGLEYVVTLRDDVLWQDGIPFTADDVVYTMSILSSPDFPGPAAVGEFWRTVETERIHDHLVRFRLTQPLGSFIEALRIGILPYHALQGTTASQIMSHPFNLTPIGTGPYQLEALRTADGRIRVVDLRAAPVYRQRPEGETGYSLERLSFHLYDNFEAALQALRDGDVDGYAARDHSERPPLLQLANSVPHTTYSPVVGVLIFNWVNDDFAVFREQRVRQALEIGLNRDSIIQRHMFNTAVRADSPLPLLSWAYNGSLQWPAYAPDTARSLLETANIRVNRTPVEVETEEDQDTPTPEPESDALFRFTILTPDNATLVSVANEIAAQWSLLRIDVAVEAVDIETYSRRLQSGEFDAALVELSNKGSADPDVYNFWHQGQYPTGQNYGGANDRVISEALERARQEASGTNRVLHYHQFQEAFITRAIAIPLYYPLYTYAITADITGVQMGFIGAPADRFLTIRDWHIER